MSNIDYIVEATNLEKTFKDFWHRPKVRAVKGVNFKVKRGEVFGLLGPNGSGKSTTIKMLLGLLNPTNGYVRILGLPPKSVIARERLGYLPEETYLHSEMTANEIIDYYGRLLGLSSEERESRTKQLLEMVGIDHVADRRIGTFSKGMLRRVGLAQALIGDPDLLILDEPTSGLDPLGCKEVKDLISLLAKHGKTIILSSHRLADMESICDRIAIMLGGEVAKMGKLDSLLKKSDSFNISMPTEIIENFKSWLEMNNLTDRVEIESSKRSLEKYFVDIVNSADSSGDGAKHGGDCAQYLLDDEDEDEEDLIIDEEINIDDILKQIID